jgi:hypothetical protein
MQSWSTFFAAMACLIILGMAIWNKPACREGFLPSLFLNGWACVPGYKP